MSDNFNWISDVKYTHPSEYLREKNGYVVLLSDDQTYAFSADNRLYGCPQGWAATIHIAELKTDEKSTVTARLPTSIKRSFFSKLAKEGKKAQAVIESCILEYTYDLDTSPEQAIIKNGESMKGDPGFCEICGIKIPEGKAYLVGDDEVQILCPTCYGYEQKQIPKSSRGKL